MNGSFRAGDWKERLHVSFIALFDFFFFFTLCLHSIFPLKIVGLKCLIKGKTLKIITCFKRTKPNQEIVLGLSFTN